MSRARGRHVGGPGRAAARPILPPVSAPPQKRAPFLLTAGGWPYLLVPFIPLAIALDLAHASAVADLRHLRRSA